MRIPYQRARSLSATPPAAPRVPSHPADLQPVGPLRPCDTAAPTAPPEAWTAPLLPLDTAFLGLVLASFLAFFSCFSVAAISSSGIPLLLEELALRLPSFAIGSAELQPSPHLPSNQKRTLCASSAPAL